MNHWEEIVAVPLPLPFPLKWITAYVFVGSYGISIVDTGLHTPESLQTWEQAFAENGWRWEQVDKIVLTHYHPDHFGLAGTLQQKTGAPVYISELDWEQAQLFWSRTSSYHERMTRFFAQHGMEERFVQQLPAHLAGFHKWVEPHPQVSFLRDGDRIELGDRVYEVIHTPGHADGHLSFYDPERKWLIGGDVLLPKITPNISLWPGCNPNPLAEYLQTLKKLKTIEVKQVFPAHGAVFTNYQERIGQIEQHHEHRLNKILKFLEINGRVNAWQVCTDLFGTNLTIHNLRFAFSETLAHLEYLRSIQKVTLLQIGEQYFYQL
jgi:glyoxylase-like metal-dependent hydrolase (beta-lactamase superfamily II)